MTDQQIDLRDSGADDPRNTEKDEPFDTGRHSRAFEMQGHPGLARAPNHGGGLRCARQSNRSAQSQTHIALIKAELRTNQQSRNHENIQQDRHPCRQSEAVAGVEHSREQRRHRHEEQIRHGDHRVEDRQIIGRDAVLIRSAVQTKADNIERERHGELKSNHQQSDRRKKRSCGFRRKVIGRRLAVLLDALCIKRNKGGVKRPFGEHASEDVGQFEGGEEGIRHRARSEITRDQHIPDKTQYAANEG